jgi:hypothetical protein
VWSGPDASVCRIDGAGACWAFVRAKFSQFIYGRYPIEERWRVDIFFAMLAVGIFWLLSLRAPRRDIGAVYFFIVMPLNKLAERRARGQEPEPTALTTDQELLTEIRDLLRTRQP